MLAHAATWSTQTGGALLNTEFGATTDPAAIDRMVGELDRALLPWIWWSYDELVADMTKPPTGANIAHAAVAELIRPHPVAVAGTPTALDYNPRTRVLAVSWSTTGPEPHLLPRRNRHDHQGPGLRVREGVFGAGARRTGDIGAERGAAHHHQQSRRGDGHRLAAPDLRAAATRPGPEPR